MSTDSVTVTGAIFEYCYFLSTFDYFLFVMEYFYSVVAVLLLK